MSIRSVALASVFVPLIFAVGPDAAAQLPVPIKDINPRTEGGSIYLGAELDGWLYYGGCYQEDFFGCELVRTPIGGTGVERVKDIQPGPDGSSPTDFHVAGGLVFFRANGDQLWASDGTEDGTRLVRGFADLADARTVPWAVVGDQLFFSAESTPSAGRELWTTDGTTTTMISLCPGSCGGNPVELTAAGGRLFFRADDGSEVELWTYENGTATKVTDINPSGSSSPSDVAALGSSVIFQAYDGSELGLYVSDGTSTTKLAGSAQSFHGLEELVVAGSVAFFDGYDGNALSGRELWVSNGTVGGTGLVADIAPGVASSDPDDLTPVGSSLFFTADDGTTGRELWISVAGGGSTLPLELVPGPGGPPTLQDLSDLNGGVAFFAADDGTGAGIEPWRSDGTPAGTFRIADLAPGPEDGIDVPVLTTSGVAFFASSALDEGRELWRSDGTAGGTLKLTELDTTGAGSDIDRVVSFAGLGYFCADDGAHGDELWRTDGTPQGTVLVQDVAPGPDPASGCGGELTVVGSTLFFRGYDGTSHGIWRSNGQPGGAALVKSFPDQPDQLTAHGGALYFVADDGGGAGEELWRSDGTTGGTVLVKDLYPGSLPANVTDLTSAGGALYFGGRHTTTGDFELWRSDGTASGTAVLKDIRPGPSGSFPRDFGSVGSTVLFTANDGSNGTEVWKTDGTAGGTVMVADIDPVGSGAQGADEFLELGSFAYFVGDDGATGRELWRTNGTAGGTNRVADIRPGSSGSSPRDLAVAGSKIYFAANDGTTGHEPWASDGSTTTRLADVDPSGSSNPRAFFPLAVGDQAYFQADDGAGGSELWFTDGTPGGTALVADLFPDGGSNPRAFAHAGSRVVFSANVGSGGNELWSFGAADCGDAPDPTYGTLVMSGGACHATGSGLFLGGAADDDPDGQPNATADGDDADGSDDEDGVSFPTPFNRGGTATVEVTLSAPGRLHAWIDWDADGGWTELDDHVVFDQALGAGTHSLSIHVPSGAAVGDTFARFRLASAGVPYPGGIAFDGEVEDHRITVEQLTADLGITKTAPATAIPGTDLQYLVVASNPAGPSSATGATVTDQFDSNLSGCTWTCSGTAGGSCPSAGAGDLDELVDLPVGGSVTFVATCAIASDAAGDVESTAEILPPPDIQDTNSANDYSDPTTTLVPTGNLSVIKTDGEPWVEPPATLNYTIEVSNAGPSDAFDARVEDTFPPEVTNVSWTCTPTGVASCAGVGAGDIDESVDLPAGTSVLFTALADTVGGGGQTVVNTATVTAPVGFTDPDPGDDSATDVTLYPILADQFESGDFTGWSAVVGAAESVADGLGTVPHRRLSDHPVDLER